MYGVVNLGLAVTVTMGATMQAQFLPATVGRCKGSKSVQWQVVEGHPSFFTLAAQLTKNDPGKAEAVCKDLVGDFETASAVV